MNRRLLYICLGISLSAPLCSAAASATRPPQVESGSSDGRVVVAVNQHTYAANGVFLSSDCVFQFATDLRPASADGLEYGRSFAGAAWLPGQVDKPVAVTILLRFPEGSPTSVSFAFDDAGLAGHRCTGRSTQNFVEHKGEDVQGVSLARRNTSTRLERDGALVDGTGLDRNDIVLMNYSTPAHSTAPEGYVTTPYGYVLKEDLYPVMTPDALERFYLGKAR